LKFIVKKPVSIIISILLFLAIAYLDLITGYDLGFFVFYFIPISIIAWYAGRPFAMILSLLAAVAWLLVDQMSNHPYSNWTYPFWNAFVRCTSFVILALAISEIKAMLEKEKQLKQELSQALDKIKKHIVVAKKVAEGDLPSDLQLIPVPQQQMDSLDDTFTFMLKRLSDQKNLEKRLFQLERQAIMAETASYLAHEIRNPLNLIMLTAHHIGSQFIPQDETSRKKFEELITSLKLEVQQLSQVVSDFIAMGKQSELHKTRFRLSDVIEQVQILIKQQLTNKNISLQASNVNTMAIAADIEQLRLVFLNLLVNAIAAVSANGHVWINAGHDSKKRNVIISVSDDGPGIPTEDIDNIFEPYFTSKPDGTGLGLTLVKRIIEDHNGSIRAANRDEGGAIFTISFPVEGDDCQ
jgi:nitrogen fixation/metabolism regulation signal transduction histidine kinase